MNLALPPASLRLSNYSSSKIIGQEKRAMDQESLIYQHIDLKLNASH